MEEDESLHPVPIGLLGPWAVMARTQRLAQSVEEFGLLAERADAGWGGNER